MADPTPTPLAAVLDLNNTSLQPTRPLPATADAPETILEGNVTPKTHDPANSSSSVHSADPQQTPAVESPPAGKKQTSRKTPAVSKPPSLTNKETVSATEQQLLQLTLDKITLQQDLEELQKKHEKLAVCLGRVMEIVGDVTEDTDQGQADEGGGEGEKK